MDTRAGHESRDHGSSVGVVGGTKRPYEDSSSESVVSFATDSVSVTHNSVVSGSVANSVLGPDGKRPVKSSVSTTGCRQRITVVCAECKRLKLKCDRRTPCGSCTKRDTIQRCIYSQAAAEKVDVQSLNIRLQAVEGKLSGLKIPSNSIAATAELSTRDGAASASTISAGSTSQVPVRAFLAVGAHGASVAVNLEGIAGLWVDHLGLNAHATSTRPPATVAELDLERLGGLTTRPAGGSGIDLRPFPCVASDGVLDFIKETTELFRIPASLVTSSETSEDASSTDVNADHERDYVHVGEEEGNDQIGVSPRLVHHALPSAHVRSEIYKRFEQTHFLCPSVNFFVLKNRIEEMCDWAEAELIRSSGSGSGSRENGRPDEPPPMTSSSTTYTMGPSSAPTISATGTGTFAPTLTLFASAALSLAIGARCWVIEQEVLGKDSGLNFATDRACSPGSSNGASGPSLGTYDRSMPPPPPPMPLFENDSSTSPASPPSGSSSSVPHPSASRGPSHSPIQIDPALPGNLYRTAKFALSLALERAGYEAFDIDYIHARCLQVRYLLCSYHGLGEGVDILRGLCVDRRKKFEKRKSNGRLKGGDRGEGDTVMDDIAENAPRNKGKERASTRGAALALAPEIVGAISDAVGNARMMGLNHDPEHTGGGRFSVYEIEIRRRIWWEVVILDAFVAECLGENPLINDNSATTEFPTDVDEEAFGLDSANPPAPNIESLHGNIDSYIQLCRLVDLGKKLKRKAAAFRELHRDAQPGEMHELLMTVKSEMADWFANLPDHLKLKDIPSTHSDANLTSSPVKKLPGSPAEHDDTSQVQSPYLIMLRSRLVIFAHHLFITICLPFIKGGKSEAKGRTKISEGAIVDSLGPSSKGLVELMMMEPAVYLVRVWRYLHSVLRSVHPALFMCYYFTKELFDAAVVLGHLAIEQPLFAGRALASLRLASETIRDPSVLTSKQASGTSESGSKPSEAVRIIEELILKAEAAFEAANAGLGGGFGLSSFGTPSITKRKHEEVEATSTDLLYQFRFPFVGTGVISAGPPAVPSNVASPQTDTGSLALPRSSEPTARTGTTNYRSKHGTSAATDAGTAAGDPRPTTAKLKPSHPQISVRNRNRKETSRARANSTASQRSDASHTLHPSSRSSNPSSNTHPHAAHNVQQHRIPSVEPPTPLLGPSYPGPLSTTPGPGQPHYSTPPSTSSGAPSQQAQSGGGEFPSGFVTGGFQSTSPASYGPPFPPQSGPSLPVPSQVGFDGFNMASSGQGRGGIPMNSNEPSPYAFGPTNRLDGPGPVGMHQSSGFDSLGGLPSAPSESPQDRPYSRDPVENRNQARSSDDQMGPSMRSLEDQQSSHSSLHPPQTYPPSHLQQGWYSEAPWSYYGS